MQKIISFLLIFTFFSCNFVFAQNSGQFDLVITNGKIIDGTGNPWFRADVGIINGKTVKIHQMPNKLLMLKIKLLHQVLLMFTHIPKIFILSPKLKILSEWA
jgi:urease alpha subunit